MEQYVKPAGPEITANAVELRGRLVGIVDRLGRLAIALRGPKNMVNGPETPEHPLVALGDFLLDSLREVSKAHEILDEIERLV